MKLRFGTQRYGLVVHWRRSESARHHTCIPLPSYRYSGFRFYWGHQRMTRSLAVHTFLIPSLPAAKVDLQRCNSSIGTSLLLLLLELYFLPDYRLVFGCQYPFVEEQGYDQIYH